MLFNVPFATGFGTGLYTPAAFLFATIILTIFSIGYVAMARKMRAAGGFYTFISHGLGRELGLAAGITGALAYALFEVSLLGGFSYFAPTNFNDWFGWEIPWIAFALFAAMLISVLCFFHVELSVKILGAALVSEVIILAIFDLVVFGSGGSDANGIQFESLNMFKLTDPGRGPRRRRRPVPGLLVVGRLRGDPELRGGVEGPGEDRPAGDADLGRRRSASATSSRRWPSSPRSRRTMLVKVAGDPEQPAVLPGHGAVRQRVPQGRSCRC